MALTVLGMKVSNTLNGAKISIKNEQHNNKELSYLKVLVIIVSEASRVKVMKF